MVETEARTLPEVPGAFQIACYKCCREYEVHGRESRLALILELQGWYRDGNRMVCPRCKAPREAHYPFNKTREQERRARRAA